MNSWINIQASGCQGFTMLTGTSNNFIACWSTNTQGGVIAGKEYSAYDIFGYYNNFVSAASDHAGEDGKPCRAIFRIGGGGSTAGALGAEQAHTKRLFELYGNEVSLCVSSIHMISIHNKYRTSASKDFGLIGLTDLAFLEIKSGHLAVVQIADSVNKQCFADLRVASKLKIGQLTTNSLITGINDNTENQVFMDNGCAFDLDSSNTRLFIPAPDDDLGYADQTWGGGGRGRSSFAGGLIVGSKYRKQNVLLELASSGTGFVDASIQSVTTGTPTYDYSNTALKYAAKQHEFYGRVIQPTVYSETTPNASNVYISPDGSLQRSTSSIKYKDNVSTIETADAKRIASALRPVIYTSKSENTGKIHYGFIAEEVEKVEPSLCHIDDNGEVEGVQYDRIVPILVSYIKDLEDRMNKLENS